MKELLTKIKGSKLARRTGAALVAVQGFALNVFAAPNEDGYGMVANTIDMATTWVRYLGAIAAVYGLVAFIMAWKGNNAEGQSNAGMWIICGFMLCSIKSIMTFIGII